MSKTTSNNRSVYNKKYNLNKKEQKEPKTKLTKAEKDKKYNLKKRDYQLNLMQFKEGLLISRKFLQHLNGSK